MKSVVRLAVASLMLFFAGIPTQAANTLSQSELLRLFPGSFKAIVHGMISMTVLARRDGSLIGYMSGDRDTGSWSVKGGNLCIRFSTWAGGAMKCSPVVLEAGWFKGNGVVFKKL